MTTPSAHEPYKRLARRALIGEGSIPAMSDWEVFLHGFSDTNQRGSSRDIYDCLINLFPTPESVLDWPKFDSETGEPLDLPETGGCANLRTRGGAATWIRDNADPTAWRKIRSLMRCKDRHGRQIPGSQDLARDFSDGSRLRRDGTRERPGGLNFQLRQAIQGAGMKGADMHLLWGGCEVPVIDIQMMRLIAPHVIGMSFEENARQKLEKKIDAGGALNISGVEPIATRRVLATDEINPGLRRNITAMEQEEAARIQGDKKQYEIWRNVAYELAAKEGMPANEWHVANWLEFRPPTPRLGRGDPDRDLRSRTRAEIDRDKERLELNIKFIEGTFAPTNFPDAPAEWPLPNDRYPRRERGKRLAQMEAEGLSPEEMIARERSLYPLERLTTQVVIEQLEYFHREQERYETPGAEREEESPPGWEKIRAYQIKNPDLSQAQIARDTGYSIGYVWSSLLGVSPTGQVYGPRLYAPQTEDIRTGLESRERRGAPHGGPGSPRIYSEEVKAEAVQTYDERLDLSTVEVAEMFDVTRNRLLQWVEEAGIERREQRPRLVGRRPRAYEPEFIRDYKRRTGKSQQQIADDLGISLSTVSRAIRGWSRGQTPSAFVGFEGPFGFDDNITKESKDWIQYKIGDTPVIVRRVGAKPGVKLHPRYQGANQPQELLIEFRLLASTRRDMERINFLLERVREDNPTMTVNVNVKTDGKTAHRRLPSWEDRPYRLEPAAWFGFETPKDFDDRIRAWEWRHAEVEEGIAEDGTTIDTLHEGLNGLAGEDRVSTEVITHPYTAPEFGLSAEERQIYFNNYFSNPDEAEVIWDIDGIKVTVAYHPIVVGEYSVDPYPEKGVVGDAAEISWVRTGGEISRDTFSQINALLDGIHEENPNIRIFAHAVGERVTIDPKTKKAIISPGQKGLLYAPRGRGGIRARVYERSGWTKLYDEQGDEGEGAAMMEWLPPDQRNPGTPTAFDGISAYADAIMELV